MTGTLNSLWRQTASWMCLAIIALATSRADGVVVANSIEDFSGVQGTANGQWQYGYYDGALTPGTFKKMAIYNPPSAPDSWVVDFDLPAPYYWTWLDAVGGHPNGVNKGARTQIEQWAVRRWVSNQAGAATILGIISDLDSRGGNGITARIFNGNSEIFTLDLPNGASDSNYSISTTLVVGQAIDFVIDPKEQKDFFDTTAFIGAIDVDSLTGSVAPLAGDYNANGVVDAADYVIWRKKSNTGFQLPNEVVTPGAVTVEDYTEWRKRFGNSVPGSGSGLTMSIPEPTSFVLLVVGLSVICQRRNVRRDWRLQRD